MLVEYFIYNNSRKKMYSSLDLSISGVSTVNHPYQTEIYSTSVEVISPLFYFLFEESFQLHLSLVRLEPPNLLFTFYTFHLSNLIIKHSKRLFIIPLIPQ